MTTHDRWLSSPYDDYPQDLVDAEIEAIWADADRLAEAVEEWDEAAMRLADTRIVLHDAAWLLGKIAEGLTLDEIERIPGRTGTLESFRALIRTADEAARFVDDRVQQAAAEAVQA